MPISPIPVPSLAISKFGQHYLLQNSLHTHQFQIEQWFRTQWQRTPPPFYSSVDLRNAGFKLAPVDTNLFPAGFNNLNVDFDSLCVQAVQATLQKFHQDCFRVLLIPENHSRNMRYFENVYRLMKIFNLAGYDIRCGSLRSDLTEPQTISLADGNVILLEPVYRVDNKIGVDENFFPCFILLNNDFSEGIPEILQNLNQKIMPSPLLGWQYRRKSIHFEWYDQVTHEFAEYIGIDPWLINSYHAEAKGVNFTEAQSMEALADKAQILLNKIQKKYTEYKIEETPYLIVKADSGTYGMGVMRINDAAELLKLNRKQRTKMAVSKGNQPITEVLLQEGVPSFEEVGDPASTAEPVVYMIGSYVVGGFYRVHVERGPYEILNAPGMHFEPLAFAKPCLPEVDKTCKLAINQFYTYGVIARLAALAAAHEALRAESQKS